MNNNYILYNLINKLNNIGLDFDYYKILTYIDKIFLYKYKINNILEILDIISVNDIDNELKNPYKLIDLKYLKIKKNFYFKADYLIIYFNNIKIKINYINMDKNYYVNVFNEKYENMLFYNIYKKIKKNDIIIYYDKSCKINNIINNYIFKYIKNNKINILI